MRWFCVGVAFFCAVTAWAAPIYRNYIAAIVNDKVITREAVRVATEKDMDILWSAYRDRPALLREKQLALFDEGLQNLIDRELILKDFVDSGGQFPESVIDDEIRTRIRRNFGDRAALTRTLQAQGMTTEAYRKQLRDDIIVSWMSRQHITSAIFVSPTKIENYYNEHLEEFKVGEEAKVRTLVIGRALGVTMEEMKQLALEIQSKVGTGAVFAEMAAIYSEGSQRTQGGDWGWVQRDKFNRGLSDIAFSLPPGQTSPVLGMAVAGDHYWIYTFDDDGRLASGKKYTSGDDFVEEKSFDAALDLPPPVVPQEYYLIHVEARRAARTRPLSEVRDQIEKDLTAQEQERLRRKWIDALREKSFVRYF